MPDWWYAFSYDPLVASVVSGLVVGIAMIIPTYIWTHSRTTAVRIAPTAARSATDVETLKCHSTAPIALGSTLAATFGAVLSVAHTSPAERATYEHLNQQRGLPLTYAKMV